MKLAEHFEDWLQSSDPVTGVVLGLICLDEIMQQSSTSEGLRTYEYKLALVFNYSFIDDRFGWSQCAGTACSKQKGPLMYSGAWALSVKSREQEGFLNAQHSPMFSLIYSVNIQNGK